MKTKYLTWKQTNEAAALLKEGELVAFPTDTVFGLGGIASKEAFDRLVTVKSRTPDKPFALMCSGLGQIAQYAQIDYAVLALAQAFLPGQVTLLLEPRKGLPSYLTLKSPFIGFRVPDDKDVLDLIDKVGSPVLTTSANISGAETAIDFKMAKAALDSKVAAVIDGKCRGGQATTIVSVGPNHQLTLVREGPVPFKDIEHVYSSAKPLSIALGSDHGGYQAKEAIKSHLLEKGFIVIDKGTDSDASCDYPLFGQAVGEEVSTGEADLGIVVCTTGEGIAMAANKVKGIRCGIGYNDTVSMKMREHNNANVIAFGQAHMDLEDILRRVDIFLMEKFSPLEKHHRRVDALE